MKFNITAKQFVQAVKPAVVIAQKIFGKDYGCNNKSFEGNLTIEADAGNVSIYAKSETADIRVRIGQKDSYQPHHDGIVTIDALGLMNSLKSFRSTDILTISAEDQYMKITRESNDNRNILLPTIPFKIQSPLIQNKSVQECVVDRSYFVKGFQAVAYAMGFYPLLRCLCFESVGNHIEFVAGSGDRYSRLEIINDTLLKSDEDIGILFPSIHVFNIIKIFMDSNLPDIRIRTVEAVPEEHLREQVVLDNDNITLNLYSTEELTSYPEVTSVINHEYKNRFSTYVKDWIFVSEAIKATYHLHDLSSSTADVIANLSQGCLEVQTSSEMHIESKIDFNVEDYVADTSRGESHKPWFRCDSQYLVELVKNAHPDDIVTICFDDQAKYAETPIDKPYMKKPVLIIYPDRISADGTKEKFHTLFIPSE